MLKQPARCYCKVFDAVSARATTISIFKSKFVCTVSGPISGYKNKLCRSQTYPNFHGYLLVLHWQFNIRVQVLFGFRTFQIRKTPYHKWKGYESWKLKGRVILGTIYSIKLVITLFCCRRGDLRTAKIFNWRILRWPRASLPCILMCQLLPADSTHRANLNERPAKPWPMHWSCEVNEVSSAQMTQAHSFEK